jgi:hypothetical protein
LQSNGPRLRLIAGYVEIDDIDRDDWTTEFTAATPNLDRVHPGAATVRLLAENTDNLTAPATFTGVTGTLWLRGQGRFLPEV